MSFYKSKYIISQITMILFYVQFLYRFGAEPPAEQQARTDLADQPPLTADKVDWENASPRTKRRMMKAEFRSDSTDSESGLKPTFVSAVSWMWAQCYLLYYLISMFVIICIIYTMLYELLL